MSTPAPTASTVEILQRRQTAERLHHRFEGSFSLETIDRYIGEAMDRMAGAKVTTWLGVLAERIVRDQLRAVAKIQHLITSDKPHVVFLCVHNAGRSQMAAAWMQHLAGDGAEVFSGGSDPATTVNPAAVQAMSEVGIDIAGELPLPWTDEVVQAADVVITMGCGDACPIFPGTRYEDWEITDPAGRTVEEVRAIRDDIRGRVEALMASLHLPRAS